MACAPQSFQSLLLPHEVGTGINPDRGHRSRAAPEGEPGGVLVAEGMGQEWAVLPWEMVLVSSPLTKCSATSWGWSRWVVGQTEVHLLRVDGPLGSKAPSEIFICHRCCRVDRAFPMDEVGTPSRSAWAGIPR